MRYCTAPLNCGQIESCYKFTAPHLNSWSRLSLQRYICEAFTAYFRQIPSKTPRVASPAALSTTVRRFTVVVAHDQSGQVSLLCPLSPPRLENLSTF